MTWYDQRLGDRSHIISIIIIPYLAHHESHFFRPKVLCLFQAVVLRGPRLTRGWKVVEMGVPANLAGISGRWVQPKKDSSRLVLPKIQKYLLQSRSAMICMVNLVNGCKWLFSHPMLILYCKLPSIRPSHFAVDRLWKGIVVPFAHLVSPFEEHDWHGRIQELSCSQNCLLIVRFQEWMSFISV